MSHGTAIMLLKVSNEKAPTDAIETALKRNKEGNLFGDKKVPTPPYVSLSDSHESQFIEEFAEVKTGNKCVLCLEWYLGSDSRAFYEWLSNVETDQYPIEYGKGIVMSDSTVSRILDVCKYIESSKSLGEWSRRIENEYLDKELLDALGSLVNGFYGRFKKKNALGISFPITVSRESDGMYMVSDESELEEEDDSSYIVHSLRNACETYFVAKQDNIKFKYVLFVESW